MHVVYRAELLDQYWTLKNKPPTVQLKTVSCVSTGLWTYGELFPVRVFDGVGFAGPSERFHKRFFERAHVCESTTSSAIIIEHMGERRTVWTSDTTAARTGGQFGVRWSLFGRTFFVWAASLHNR